MATRDQLRSLTLGAPARQMRRKLVTLRDATKPRVQEVELDEEGQPVLEQELDKRKRPVTDDAGEPVMVPKKRYRYPPQLDSEGKVAQVEVREPGIKLRAAIYRAAGVSAGEEASVDLAKLQVETVVALTYEPGDGQTKIFTDADKPALLSQLAGGFVDDIFEVAFPLMNVDEKGKKELEKN
jgi:hypothetical protein